MGANRNLVLTKVIQLIVANKMRQIDLKKMEQALDEAIVKEGFNIFSFTQKYY